MNSLANILESTFGPGGIRFDRPWAFWLLLWPWIAMVVRRVRPKLAWNGPVPRRKGRWAGPLWFAAATSLILGFAGPHWGKSEREGVAIGRDLVLVIDLSRSMQATDLSTPQPRWKAAAIAAADLVQSASLRGGHRIGIVVFAAKPKVLVPLTTDHNHLLQMLNELDGDVRPLEIRPDETTPSGTRIGAALQLALEAHDSRYPGVQDIVLLSDGDDPSEDREWATAIGPARAHAVPIHTVGIGGTEETPLVLKKRGDAEGELVSTKLREALLEELARDTRGTYIPARREPAPLGDFFRRSIEALPSREFSDDAIVSRKDRSPWFFAVGFACFLVAWWKAPI